MGRICLSLLELPASLPRMLPLDAVCEVRADALEPLREDELSQFVNGSQRDCLFTWRSPEEGGLGGSRPQGLLTRALSLGFRWVDVEAAELMSGSPELTGIPSEAAGIPPGSLWASHHTQESPRTYSHVEALWAHLNQTPAWLHKLVFTADSFQANRVLHQWSSRRGGRAPGCVFAQGRYGHPSRILGDVSGNEVTFCSLSGQETAPGQPTLEQLTEVYRLSRFTGPPRYYGVLGNPVLHSLSPRLHNHAFRQAGYPGLFLPLEAENAEGAVEWLRQGLLHGMSVTAPYKGVVARLADRTTDRVVRVGAANTLWVEEGELVADNTDYLAAGELLLKLGVEEGSRVALLGTGGAARAVAAALSDLGAAVILYGRNVTAGEELAQTFGCDYGGALGAVREREHQVLVNTVPVEASDILPSGRPGVLDLLYQEQPGELSPWEMWAVEHDCPLVGGREFLALQGRYQFSRWTGLEPDWDKFKMGVCA